MATAALVLGIVAIVASLVPGVGAFVAIPCGLLGAVLAVVVLVRGPGEGQGKGKPIAGLVLSVLAIVVVVAMIWAAAALVESGALDEVLNDPELQEQLEELRSPPTDE